MTSKRVWVASPFHKELKKRALDQNMSVLEFTNNIMLKGNNPFLIKNKNEKQKKKKFMFSI